jgi:hypothetical protein
MGLITCMLGAVAMSPVGGADIALSDIVADLKKDRITARLEMNSVRALEVDEFKVGVMFLYEGKNPAKLVGVNFDQRYLPAHRPSQSQVAEFLSLQHGAQPILTLYVQVDGTVSARSHLSVGKDRSRKDLVKDIESHVWAYCNFQREFKAKCVDRFAQLSTSAVDASRKVDAADPLDMRLLTSLWGWEYKKGYGFSTPLPWTFPISVAGKDVWLFYDAKYGPNAGFGMRADFKKPAEIANEWIERTNRRIAWGSVTESGRDGYMSVRGSVDLSSGLTPPEIRKNIEDFVHKVLELEKDAAAAR